MVQGTLNPFRRAKAAKIGGGRLLRDNALPFFVSVRVAGRAVAPVQRRPLGFGVIAQQGDSPFDRQPAAAGEKLRPRGKFIGRFF